MAAKSRPYEQFGTFLLFKKLESDALGELWRAASIDGGRLGTVVAMRRWTGGNREALGESAAAAHQVSPLLTGPSFVKDQNAGVIQDIPYLYWEYSGGRSLRHIVERARGSAQSPANPIPLDQAVVIAERVALSLATMAELRHGGERLAHGALMPQFVWITDDGEIRVAGQQFGSGLIASLADEKAGAEVIRYFSTEYAHSRKPNASSEVYSLGAILYLAVTGHEPPDPRRASAFVQSVRGAKTMAGAPVPDDIRQILEKSLNLDPAARFASVADMKQALSTASSKYGATSFNLAFYLSNLLKKEMESEAVDRERESKTNVVPYLQPAPAPEWPVKHETRGARSKSKLPLAVAAAGALVVVGAAGWLALGARKQATAAPAPTASLAGSMIPVTKPQPVVAEPIVAQATPAEPQAAPADVASTTKQAEIDEAARKKAFDEAVQKRLNEELMKLQADYNRQLQRQQARNAPVVTSPPPAPAPVETERPAATVAEEPAPAPVQLEQQRRESAPVQTAEVVPAPQPVVPAPVPAPLTQTSAPEPASTPAPAVVQQAAVRQGDVIDINELDVMPRRVRDPRVTYPPIAARQKIETTVMATVLVSETGHVLDVKILRGDPRFGFNDAAIRALREARFTAPMKSGLKVRTWAPQLIQFKP
jgi:TonB family protein